MRFTNFSPNNVGGGLNTLERTVDLDDKSNSLSIQLTSILSPNIFNEFRYQRAHRKSEFLPTDFTPSGVPSVTITGVASFGPATNVGTISPIQTMNQFQNNLTWNRGDHSMKFGGGFNYIYDFRRNDISAQYVFPSINAYIAAKNGTTPRGYTSYSQTLGDAEITYKSTFYNLFAQDDWKATRKLKLSYGLRYDLYDVPDGDPNAPFAEGREYKDDKNNFAPRLGLVYALREGNRPTVVRASAGIYYDTVYLAMYESALQGNGTGRYLSVSRTPAQTGAPDFPNVIPAGTTIGSLGITQNIEQIASDFENMYAMHYQAQLEQALTENLAFTLGYIHSSGRHLPVYRQINCIALPGQFLADGRPIYGTLSGNNVVPCTQKVNPAYNNIIEVQSGGNSNYNAMTMQLSKRFAQGYQFNVNYTLSRIRDDAPERYLQGVGAATQSDPSNRAFDKGYGVADQRHTLSASFVARPVFNFESKTLRYIANNNQFGFTAFAGSGETFPITTNFDLNRDGIGNDIPVGYERNAGRVGSTFNVDFRYSRVIPFTERYRLEAFFEATNIFNINSTVTYGGTSYTTGYDRTTGVYSGPFIGPTFTRTAQESRQGQIGLKFIF
ncbi:MAG: TonB-dependent receptor [Pyrinomonadaceae bacterium]|nr:TonB-dependent receptor [Pyrinomonadaceae bacterium]